MTIEQFDILEKKVNQLAEKYNQVKLEKDTFLSDLTKKQEEILTLQEKVSSFEQEQEKMKARLDKLISHLETTASNF